MKRLVLIFLFFIGMALFIGFLDRLDAQAHGLANQELLVGQLDGTNTIFSIAHPPNYTNGYLHIFRNGLRLYQSLIGDYTTSGRIITFSHPPQPGDTIFADYTY